MTHDEIIAIARDTLKRIAPDTDPLMIDVDADYRRALDLDSFDTLRFLSQVSTDLHVDIPESAYGDVATLRGLAAYIQAQNNDAG